jgi:hypothetical protein
MLRTITIGSSISIQGIFVKDMPDGRVAVKVDDTVYSGKPVLRAS